MGTPNPRPQKATLIVGSSSVVIYGKFSELGFFLGAIDVDATPTVVISNQSVNGHGRKRYPGGPSVSVDGHARRRVIEQARPEQTLPGQNAWMEKLVGSGPSATLRVEQFTFVGNFQDLKDAVKAENTGAFVLRSPAGVAYPISASS